MSDAQKIPFYTSYGNATQKKVLDRLQLVGKALPCKVVSVDGAIVTVDFEINSEFTLPQITCPLFGPQYIRYPLQPGDMGVVFAADAYLSGVSGLGGGVADLSAPANLAALVFFPVGNKTWVEVDPQSVTIYGPGGVVLRDTGSNSIVTLTPSGITIITGLTSFTMTAAGNYSLTGLVGLIEAPDLTISDGTFKTNPSTMHTVWAALEAWANTHTHPVSGGTASATNTPYAGGTIAPGV